MLAIKQPPCRQHGRVCRHLRLPFIGQNINRRHLSKGQKAMASAMILPESQQGKKAPASQKSWEVHEELLRQARAIRRLAPELVPGVLKGTMPLKEAYDKAKAREAEAQSAEARMAKLRLQPPY